MDIYNIPNDTGKDWRLKKFVEYQHEVPSIHYRVMGEYIKRHIVNKDDAVMMCWYMSCTYNEITCALLEEIFNWKALTPKTVSEYCKNFWEQHKENLDFGSSRKYAKNMDWFPKLIESFVRATKKHPYSWLKSFNSSYEKLYKSISKIPFTGRFSADLFMESVLYLNDYFGTSFVAPSKLDWKNCSNLTSGLYNIFYMDEEANEFDKSGKLSTTEADLTQKLELVQKEIEKVYPEQENDINLFVGKICSFRNLFKSSRYGGFHHDRELGVLKEYERIMPEYQHIWDRIYAIRKDMFEPRFLGELNGWNGIRKERKKLFLTQGLTGVEK